MSMITPKADEGSQSPLPESRQVQFKPTWTDYHFATWHPENHAAIHLLELAKPFLRWSSNAEQYLKVVNDTEGYLLSLASPTGDARDWSALRPSCGPWRLGAGIPPENKPTPKPSPEVYFLLCPINTSLSSQIARKDMAGVHAELSFHRESGVLMMHSLSDKPIVYESGQDGADFEFHQGSEAGKCCVLFQENNFFRFGSYKYSLTFIETYTKQYVKLKNWRDEIMLRQGIIPSRHLDMLPNPQPKIQRKVWLHRLLFRDAVSEVWSGVRLHDGKPLAVKKLKYKRATANRVALELRLVSFFHGRALGVLGMTDCWCQHDVTPPCQLTRECFPKAPVRSTENMYYSMPLAEYDFLSMCWDDVSREDRVGLFKQTLEGLGMLHGNSIMHCAIRPSCLMIFRSGDPEFTAAIGSPGHHSRKKLKWGPPAVDGPWVAPEVYESTQESPYSNKADVWSLAISWVYAFRRPLEENEEINMVAIGHVRDLFEEGKITRNLRDLWVRMLDPDPHGRPSVPEALQNSAWEASKGSKDKTERNLASGKGNKRKRT